MISTYHKLDIADDMLDAAIEAFIDTKHYFVAINLAGVAEDLYGGFIDNSGGKHAKSELIKLAEYISSIEGTERLPHKEWQKIANHNKNHVKHLNSLEPDQLFIELDAEDEARAAIGIAITNHDKLGREPSPALHRFWMFAKTWSENKVAVSVGPT